MAIERSRMKKIPKPDQPPWWEVQIKVTGHYRWIKVGHVKRLSTHWFGWQCEPQPWRFGPTLGREQTRGEAVTALLAHVRTGNHPHTQGSPTP